MARVFHFAVTPGENMPRVETAPNTPSPASPRKNHLLYAWIALCLALALHVTDEAATGFLSVYNPTVMAMRARLPWLPFPIFRSDVWLGGLIVAIALLLALSFFVARRAAWMRPIAYLFAILMIANGMGHTLGTIFGRTVASVRFPRPMPGFYSSPFLLAASLYLLFQLRRTAPQARTKRGLPVS